MILDANQHRDEAKRAKEILDKVTKGVRTWVSIVNEDPSQGFNAARAADLWSLKAEVLEAQCAAYREALKKASRLVYTLVVAGHYLGDKELLQKCEEALSSDAGRAMLERVKKLEAALEEIAALGCDNSVLVPEIGWNLCDECPSCIAQRALERSGD